MSDISAEPSAPVAEPSPEPSPDAGSSGDQGNLLSSASEAASATSDWMQGIDKQYLASQTVSNAKDPNDLAKQVVNLEKVMGKPRVALPEETWDKNQFDEFYGKLGRPESPDQYAIEGLPEQFQFEEEDKTQILQSLHEAGLSQGQAQTVMKSIADREVALDEKVDGKMAQSLKEAQQTLKKDWGDDYEYRMRLSGATLSNVGIDSETAERLEQKYGNDPDFIKLLSTAGEKLMDDTAFKGDVESNSWSSPVAAQAEIEQLKADRTFQSQLTNKLDPGHKPALARWERAFKNAYPSQ